MDQEKIGNFIKELRKKNNLTQKDLAEKYGVTYQAVSKWENGLNLPDVSLIRKMSKDFNVSVEDLLDGKSRNNNKKKILICTLVSFLIIIIVISTTAHNKKPSFDFKTISTTCSEFKVSGSLAYDKDKSSIYISNINYCGGDDNTVYKQIECTLYETDNKISSCQSEGDVTLEEYLKDVKLNINNYAQTCKNYTDDSLYLEIKATDGLKTTSYKIPLSLNNNCPE